MKKLALLFAVLFVTINLAGQGVLSQFTKVTRGRSVTELVRAEGDKHIDWFIKPAAQLTGYALQWNSATKVFDSKQFAAFGLGAALQHYTERNAVLVPDFNINGMFIMNMITPDSPGLGLAVGGTALGFINLTVGRDFTNKVWLIMPGATWTF